MQMSRRKSAEIEVDGEIQRSPLRALAMPAFPATFSVKTGRMKGRLCIIIVIIIDVTIILLYHSPKLPAVLCEIWLSEIFRSKLFPQAFAFTSAESLPPSLRRKGLG